MNILIIKTSAIGDVTHTMPALNALRNKYPDATIHWLVEEAASDIIKGHKAIDRVIVSKRKSWIKNFKNKNFLQTIKEIHYFIKDFRSIEYDLLIDFQSLLKSGIFVALAKAKRKVGFGRGMEHSEYSYIFLNERITPIDMNIHALKRDLILIEKIGIPYDKIEFNFPINESDNKNIDILLKQNNVDFSKPVCCINPMTKWKTKLWQNNKFAIVADKLINEGNTIVFTGSKEDINDINEIMSFMKNTSINLAGKTTLKELASLYKKSSLLISTDTGPMHISAAVFTPVVAIFGPTSPWRTGPYGDIHKVVRLDMPCSPCLKKQCNTIDCMNNISPDQIFNEAMKILTNAKSNNQIELQI